MFDEQPTWTFRATEAGLGANQHPRSAKFLSVESEFQISFAKGSVDIGNFGSPGASIPKHDSAASVLAFRNNAFERAVIERMVFHLSGEAFYGWVERRSLGHGPGQKHAAPLQPEVVMQIRRCMFLNDVQQIGFCGGLRLGSSARLGSNFEIPLPLIFLENWTRFGFRHGCNGHFQSVISAWSMPFSFM